MTQTITKHKWFWAWQNNKEEAWLENMARQGYHLVSVNYLAKYIFKVGEPKNSTYRLDFNFKTKDYENYLQLFKDAGWDLVSEFGGWLYFRTEQSGQKSPEIYTDQTSRMVKYQRLLLYLTLFLPVILFTITIDTTITGPLGWLFGAVQIFMRFYVLVYLVFMGAFLYHILKIRKGNQSDDASPK